MSRAHSPLWRPAAVWAVVTAASLAAWTMVDTSVTSLASERVWVRSFEDLLVAVASAALVASASWLWLITTVTVVDVAAGRTPSGRGVTRRLVLVACGVAVVASISSPALAVADGPGLEGLPFPDRAVSDASSNPAPRPQRTVVDAPAARPVPSSALPTRHEPIVVRPGDSLWSIARAGLSPGADTREIDARWRALYAANRSAIGPDPDLIRPGQQLRPDSDR